MATNRQNSNDRRDEMDDMKLSRKQEPKRSYLLTMHRLPCMVISDVYAHSLVPFSLFSFVLMVHIEHVSNQRIGNANEAKMDDNNSDDDDDDVTNNNNKLPGDTKPDPVAMALASLGGRTQSKSDRKVDSMSLHLAIEQQLPNPTSSQQGQTNKSRGRGRARLPEKLMDHLNADTVPGVLWWLPGNESFAIESARVQTELLDVHFRGTKLSSFIRSLNRW